MARGIYLIVGQLAPDMDVLEYVLVVQEELYQVVDFGNTEDVLFHNGNPFFGLSGQKMI